jgi:hypothetical protein
MFCDDVQGRQSHTAVYFVCCCRQEYSRLNEDLCPCLNAHRLLRKKYVKEPDASIYCFEPG